MKVGNIVTKYEFNEDSSFNVFKNYEDIDNDLPTLIVGWKEMIKVFPKQPILRNKINETTFWEFSKFEDRNKYTLGIEKFIQKCYDIKFNSFDLLYVDLIKLPLTHIKKIIFKIKNSDNLITYYNENDIIIFSDNILFCLNIGLLNLFDINIPKLKNKLNKISKSILPNKTSEDNWNYYSERLYNDESLKPVLYSFLNI